MPDEYGVNVDLDEYERRLAEQMGIPLHLAKALRGLESGGTKGTNIKGPMTASGDRARGRYQVMPKTARSLGIQNPDDPFDNTYAGLAYLKEGYDHAVNMAKTEGERWALALTYYHGGPNKQIDAARTGVIRGSDRQVNKQGQVTYKGMETSNYVRRIMGDAIKAQQDEEAAQGQPPAQAQYQQPTQQVPIQPAPTRAPRGTRRVPTPIDPARIDSIEDLARQQVLGWRERPQPQSPDQPSAPTPAPQPEPSPTPPQALTQPTPSPFAPTPSPTPQAAAATPPTADPRAQVLPGSVVSRAYNRMFGQQAPTPTPQPTPAPTPDPRAQPMQGSALGAIYNKLAGAYSRGGPAQPQAPPIPQQPQQPPVTPQPPVVKAQYETRLTPPQEANFQKWLDGYHQLGAITDGDYDYYKKNGQGYDYDFRAAFKAKLTPDPQTGHWSDLGKKPNHPTFSDQSKYAADAAKAGIQPGHWQGNQFIPPQKQDLMAEYFARQDAASQQQEALLDRISRMPADPTPPASYEERQRNVAYGYGWRKAHVPQGPTPEQQRMQSLFDLGQSRPEEAPETTLVREIKPRPAPAPRLLTPLDKYLPSEPGYLSRKQQSEEYAQHMEQLREQAMKRLPFADAAEREDILERERERGGTGLTKLGTHFGVGLKQAESRRLQMVKNVLDLDALTGGRRDPKADADRKKRQDSLEARAAITQLAGEDRPGQWATDIAAASGQVGGDMLTTIPATILSTAVTGNPIAGVMLGTAGLQNWQKDPEQAILETLMSAADVKAGGFGGKLANKLTRNIERPWLTQGVRKAVGAAAGAGAGLLTETGQEFVQSGTQLSEGQITLNQFLRNLRTAAVTGGIFGAGGGAMEGVELPHKQQVAEYLASEAHKHGQAYANAADNFQRANTPEEINYWAKALVAARQKVDETAVMTQIWEKQKKAEQIAETGKGPPSPRQPKKERVPVPQEQPGVGRLQHPALRTPADLTPKQIADLPPELRPEEQQPAQPTVQQPAKQQTPEERIAELEAELQTHTPGTVAHQQTLNAINNLKISQQPTVPFKKPEPVVEQPMQEVEPEPEPPKPPKMTDTQLEIEARKAALTGGQAYNWTNEHPLWKRIVWDREQAAKKAAETKEEYKAVTRREGESYEDFAARREEAGKRAEKAESFRDQLTQNRDAVMQRLQTAWAEANPDMLEWWEEGVATRDQAIKQAKQRRDAALETRGRIQDAISELRTTKDRPADYNKQLDDLQAQLESAKQEEAAANTAWDAASTAAGEFDYRRTRKKVDKATLPVESLADFPHLQGNIFTNHPTDAATYLSKPEYLQSRAAKNIIAGERLLQTRNLTPLARETLEMIVRQAKEVKKQADAHIAEHGNEGHVDLKGIETLPWQAQYERGKESPYDNYKRRFKEASPTYEGLREQAKAEKAATEQAAKQPEPAKHTLNPLEQKVADIEAEMQALPEGDPRREELMQKALNLMLGVDEVATTQQETAAQEEPVEEESPQAKAARLRAEREAELEELGKRTPKPIDETAFQEKEKALAEYVLKSVARTGVSLRDFQGTLSDPVWAPARLVLSPAKVEALLNKMEQHGLIEKDSQDKYVLAKNEPVATTQQDDPFARTGEGEVHTAIDKFKKEQGIEDRVSTAATPIEEGEELTDAAKAAANTPAAIAERERIAAEQKAAADKEASNKAAKEASDRKKAEKEEATAKAKEERQKNRKPIKGRKTPRVGTPEERADKLAKDTSEAAKYYANQYEMEKLKHGDNPTMQQKERQAYLLSKLAGAEEAARSATEDREQWIRHFTSQPVVEAAPVAETPVAETTPVETAATTPVETVVEPTGTPQARAAKKTKEKIATQPVITPAVETATAEQPVGESQARINAAREAVKGLAPEDQRAATVALNEAQTSLHNAQSGTKLGKTVKQRLADGKIGDAEKLLQVLSEKQQKQEAANAPIVATDLADKAEQIVKEKVTKAKTPKVAAPTPEAPVADLSGMPEGFANMSLEEQVAALEAMVAELSAAGTKTDLPTEPATQPVAAAEPAEPSPEATRGASRIKAFPTDMPEKNAELSGAIDDVLKNISDVFKGEPGASGMGLGKLGEMKQLPDLMRNLRKVGSLLMEAGDIRFEAWADKMERSLKNYAEAIRPYLKEVYVSLRDAIPEQVHKFSTDEQIENFWQYFKPTERDVELGRVTKTGLEKLETQHQALTYLIHDLYNKYIMSDTYTQELARNEDYNVLMGWIRTRDRIGREIATIHKFNPEEVDPEIRRKAIQPPRPLPPNEPVKGTVTNQGSRPSTDAGSQISQYLGTDLPFFTNKDNSLLLDEDVYWGMYLNLERMHKAGNTARHVERKTKKKVEYVSFTGDAVDIGDKPTERIPWGIPKDDRTAGEQALVDEGEQRLKSMMAAFRAVMNDRLKGKGVESLTQITPDDYVDWFNDYVPHDSPAWGKLRNLLASAGEDMPEHAYTSFQEPTGVERLLEPNWPSHASMAPQILKLTKDTVPPGRTGVRLMMLSKTPGALDRFSDVYHELVSDKFAEAARDPMAHGLSPQLNWVSVDNELERALRAGEVFAATQPRSSDITTPQLEAQIVKQQEEQAIASGKKEAMTAAEVELEAEALKEKDASRARRIRAGEIASEALKSAELRRRIREADKNITKIFGRPDTSAIAKMALERGLKVEVDLLYELRRIQGKKLDDILRIYYQKPHLEEIRNFSRDSIKQYLAEWGERMANIQRPVLSDKDIAWRMRHFLNSEENIAATTKELSDIAAWLNIDREKDKKYTLSSSTVMAEFLFRHGEIDAIPNLEQGLNISDWDDWLTKEELAEQATISPEELQARFDKKMEERVQRIKEIEAEGGIRESTLKPSMGQGEEGGVSLPKEAPKVKTGISSPIEVAHQFRMMELTDRIHALGLEIESAAARAVKFKDAVDKLADPTVQGVANDDKLKIAVAALQNLELQRDLEARQAEYQRRHDELENGPVYMRKDSRDEMRMRDTQRGVLEKRLERAATTTERNKIKAEMAILEAEATGIGLDSRAQLSNQFGTPKRLTHRMSTQALETALLNGGLIGAPAGQPDTSTGGEAMLVSRAGAPRAETPLSEADKATADHVQRAVATVAKVRDILNDHASPSKLGALSTTDRLVDFAVHVGEDKNNYLRAEVLLEAARNDLTMEQADDLYASLKEAARLTAAKPDETLAGTEQVASRLSAYEGAVLPTGEQYDNLARGLQQHGLYVRRGVPEVEGQRLVDEADFAFMRAKGQSHLATTPIDQIFARADWPDDHAWGYYGQLARDRANHAVINELDTLGGIKAIQGNDAMSTILDKAFSDLHRKEEAHGVVIPMHLLPTIAQELRKHGPNATRMADTMDRMWGSYDAGGFAYGDSMLYVNSGHSRGDHDVSNAALHELWHLYSKKVTGSTVPGLKGQIGIDRPTLAQRLRGTPNKAVIRWGKPGDWIQNDAAYKHMKKGLETNFALGGRTVDAAFVEQEGAAYVLSGHWKELGFSGTPAAKSFLKRFVKQLHAEHGEEAMVAWPFISVGPSAVPTTLGSVIQEVQDEITRAEARKSAQAAKYKPSRIVSLSNPSGTGTTRRGLRRVHGEIPTPVVGPFSAYSAPTIEEAEEAERPLTEKERSRGRQGTYIAAVDLLNTAFMIGNVIGGGGMIAYRRQAQAWGALVDRIQHALPGGAPRTVRRSQTGLFFETRPDSIEPALWEKMKAVAKANGDKRVLYGSNLTNGIEGLKTEFNRLILNTGNIPLVNQRGELYASAGKKFDKGEVGWFLEKALYGANALADSSFYIAALTDYSANMSTAMVLHKKATLGAQLELERMEAAGEDMASKKAQKLYKQREEVWPYTIEQMSDKIIADAKEAVFYGDNIASKNLVKLKNWMNVGIENGKLVHGYEFGAGSFLMSPYVKIPVNIAYTGMVTYSPIGMLRPLFNFGRQIATGVSSDDPHYNSLAMGKGLTGTVNGYVMGAILQMLGVIQVPDDDKDRYGFGSEEGYGRYKWNWSQLGRLMTSRLIFQIIANKFEKDPQRYIQRRRELTTPKEGKDVSMSYDWLQPWGMQISGGAAIADTWGQGKISAAPFAVILHSLANAEDALTDQSVVKQLGRFTTGIGLAASGRSEEAFREWKPMLTGYLGRYIPSAMRLLAQFVDTTRRDTRAEVPGTITGFASESLKRAMVKIPWASKTLAPWPGSLTGEPMDRTGGSTASRVWGLFAPGELRRFGKQPGADLLRELDLSPASAKRTAGEPTSLLRLREAAIAKSFGERLAVQSEKLHGMTPEKAAEKIKSLRGKAGEAAPPNRKAIKALRKQLGYPEEPID